MLPGSLHFRYFTFFPDILSQGFDPMIYKSFSGVENVIPYLILTDVAVAFPLCRLTFSKIYNLKFYCPQKYEDYRIYNNCACFQKGVKKNNSRFIFS